MQVEDVNGNTVSEYFYDPFGCRLWKEVGGARTYFFYADEGLIAEYDAAGNELRAYGYKPDSTWTTDPLWLKQGGEYYFYQHDHLGSRRSWSNRMGPWSGRLATALLDRRGWRWRPSPTTSAFRGNISMPRRDYIIICIDTMMRIVEDT